ncbi:sensor histidine kinase [Parvularcula marina]|uniref:histidine kinase n=1 Tax=Parvularcula marina TaxID=2292771 RepID=A0A371R8E0_9PROT|nr:HAMP domain-containing sensor histidine kinase [Parvularcula marina]RFB01699.1 sensor histidine kinase [Parvularcula marina]
MTAVRAARSRRHKNDLLNVYAERLGDAIRRHHSGVALRAAKVETELAYRARGAFLASMNHELRTPLNAITGFAGILRQAEEMQITPEQKNEYIDYILQSADLLLSHINTILEIADAESGGTKLSRRAVDILDVLTQTMEALEEDDAIDVTFTRDFGGELPPVDVDPDKVAIAFRHLVEFLNSDEPVSIKVSTRRGLAGESANYVYIAFDATGTEVDAKMIDESLRVFEQVHEGLYRQFDPRRLGLPIAKSYIELNKGKFSIKTKPDDGVLIRFSLPVASEEHKRAFERLAS